MKCSQCGGKGSIMIEAVGGTGWTIKPCPVCHGNGRENISKNDILLLVDMQNGFRNENTEHAIRELKQFLNEYHMSKIMAIKFVNYPDSLFVNKLGYEHMMGAYAQDIVPELKDLVSCIYLKDTYGLVDAGLLSQMKLLNEGIMPKQVLLAGFDTDACVLATAIGLFNAGIQPFILVDFTASTRGAEAHTKALEIMDSMFGTHSLLRLG